GLAGRAVDEVRAGRQRPDRPHARPHRPGHAARPRRRGDRMKRREFITLLGGVSPLRNSRLAVILFAASLIILCGNAAMAMTLKSPAFQQNTFPRSTPARVKMSRRHLRGRMPPTALKVSF